MRRALTWVGVALACAGCREVRRALPPVPAAPREGEKPFAGGIEELRIQNDFGLVSAGPSGGAEGLVRYRIRASAPSEEEAERLAGGTDVAIAPEGKAARLLVIAPPIPPGAALQVDLDVGVPGGVARLVTAAGGDILANGLPPESHLEARQGKVHVFGASGKLAVSTRGGPIQIEGTPREVDVRSGRGAITLWWMGPGPLSGKIESDAGLVQVRAREELSARVRATTQLGRITCDLPLEGGEARERDLRGTLGGGEGTLEIRSYRGDIQILKAGR